MEKKTDEVFDALFKLEEIRQILRDSLRPDLIMTRGGLEE